MPIIKRYSNRKLYDTEARRYVALEDIRSMLRLGEEVKVIDHETGVDMTTIIMTQVLFEQEKKIGGLLPSIFLSRLVQTSSSHFHNLQEGVRAFLDPVLHIEEDIQRRLNILVEEKSIEPEEAARLANLLINPRFRQSVQNINPDEESISLDEIQSLIQKIELIEQQITAMQDSSDKM